jgi:hypothetical protein
MKKLVYTNAQEGVSIVYPVPKSNVEQILGPLTDEDYEKHVYSVSIPKDAKNPRALDDNEIPKDRYFRDAWIDNNGKLDIHLLKARDVHINKLRELRNEKLKASDAILLKALETQDRHQIKSISLLRQSLRDMPQTINLDSITDLEKLKNYVPEIIKK